MEEEEDDYDEEIHAHYESKRVGYIMRVRR